MQGTICVWQCRGNKYTHKNYLTSLQVYAERSFFLLGVPSRTFSIEAIGSEITTSSIRSSWIPSRSNNAKVSIATLEERTSPLAILFFACLIA
ncbi:hypothetical protein G5S_1025 [Chlamydia pecorum E58]|uniref:Uncharacterized protein n=1 Tax=Chlamydia pecorum (strain ATCC VR-628 / DSM 29919 / E58) TaxID=331635 RepID=A0AA34RE00_CHLPE|nr:hypothetical protein G5S_1025 [Chlamydia pecorum E58]